MSWPDASTAFRSGGEPEPSLRAFALRCIAAELRPEAGEPVVPEDAPPTWHRLRACFVTLRIGGELRGCTGSFDDRQPLAASVASNARRAAFHDSRFEPLSRAELPRLEASISVLGPMECLPADSRADLLERLRPGVDGLVVIDAGERRATFLPAVWESLPDPSDFLDALWQKAGLAAGYWSPTLSFERYTTTDAG